MSLKECEELKQRLERLEEALRHSEGVAMAGRFAGAVMHEINNPLEAITNLVYLSEREAENPPLVRKRMRAVEQQLARLREIAGRTLKFYRSANKAEPFDLVDLIQSALSIYDRRLQSQGIHLETDLPETFVTPCFGAEIFQVISNVVVNAIDALPRQGKLSIRLHSFRNEVHILIADNGHGIPLEFRDRIFEPFQTTKANSGSGLGLWICKTILDKHHGRIRCRSSVREGRSGTAFRISLAA